MTLILVALSLPLSGDFSICLFRYPHQFAFREGSAGSLLHPSMNLSQYLAQYLLLQPHPWLYRAGLCSLSVGILVPVRREAVPFEAETVILTPEIILVAFRKAGWALLPESSCCFSQDLCVQSSEHVCQDLSESRGWVDGDSQTGLKMERSQTELKGPSKCPALLFEPLFSHSWKKC